MGGDKPPGVTDVVLFNLKADVTKERFLATVDAASQWAQQQAGFVSRELLLSPDARWIEIVKWESLHDAEVAAEAEQSADACQPMFGLIEWDSMVILRGAPAITPVSRASHRTMAKSDPASSTTEVGWPIGTGSPSR